jgi:16S rRNA (guanine527-N7)-methyltransferase
VEEQLDHSAGFIELVRPAIGRGVDLGSGGGLPGFALADAYPGARWVLLDADLRRVRFLEHAIAELGMANVAVVHARAEDYGRGDARCSFDVACARSFGSPGVTAECAAALLRAGGRLVVSDPPSGAGERWPEDGLAQLGLTVDRHAAIEAGHFTVLRQEVPCPPRYPRRAGTPQRRPLF